MSFRRPLSQSLDVLLAGTVYFLCASAALLLTRFDGGLAITWLAGAWLFARLCTRPRHEWPHLIIGCMAAGIAAAMLFGFGRGIAIPLAGLSILEAWAAAWLIKRVHPRFGRFETVAEVCRFIAVGGIVTPLAGASIVALCAHMAGGVPYGTAWLNWFAGHGLGMITFAPPIMLTLRGDMARWRRAADRRAKGETSALVAAIVVACLLTFGQNVIPLVIIPFVPMIMATFRLGRFGAVVSITILTVIGMGCSLAGMGPTSLLHLDATAKFQVLQIYLASVVLILLPVAAELKSRRRLLERLRSAEALHRLILDRTSDVVLRTGPDGTVQYASSSALQVWGHDSGALLGRSDLDYVLLDDRSKLADARRSAVAHPDNTVVAEYRIVRSDGRIVWVENHMRAAVDGKDTTGIVGIVREVTERKKAVEELARRASTDPLTGIANRRAFDDALEERLAGQASGYVAILDLDHFKRVNDRYGHSVGDSVLVHFAALLRASVREEDFVARLNGEEFALLLDEADREHAQAICTRIIDQLRSAPVRTNMGDNVRVTVSIGLAMIRKGDAATLLMAADRALYRAKNGGRDQLALAA